MGCIVPHPAADRAALGVKNSMETLECSLSWGVLRRVRPEKKTSEYMDYGIVRGDGVEDSPVVAAAAAHVGDGLSLESIF